MNTTQHWFLKIGIIEFTRRVFLGGKLSPKGALLLLVYYFQLIFAFPVGLLQSLIISGRIYSTTISQDPIFILGHYRSGTTYLHKLLNSDHHFGCLTNYDAILPNVNLLLGTKMRLILQILINKLKITNPFFNDIQFQLSEPAEEDDFLMNKASPYTAYWGLIFPRCWRGWLNHSEQLADPKYRVKWQQEYLHTVKYATMKNNGKQLVLKSPPNTERIPVLLELFPNAKFIYLHRNPYTLFYSTLNMWKNVILNYFSVQKISDYELEKIVFGHFSHLIDRYQEDKKMIPDGNLIEITYEELICNPFTTVKKIYAVLKLRDFQDAIPDLLARLEIEKNYRGFQLRHKQETHADITNHWKKYIKYWNNSRWNTDTMHD